MLAPRSLRRHFVAFSNENCYADDTNTKDKKNMQLPTEEHMPT